MNIRRLKGDPQRTPRTHAGPTVNKEVKTAHGGAAQEPAASTRRFEDTPVVYKLFKISVLRLQFQLLCSLLVSDIRHRPTETAVGC